MATADPMADTPSRLLRRVQQMEDMELPSLPSIQHEIDYDSESTSEGETSMDRSADVATPHPLRQVHVPDASTSLPHEESRANSSSFEASPYPPPMRGREETPSPYLPGAALISTPASVISKRSKSNLASIASVSDAQSGPTVRRLDRKSGNDDLSSSTKTGRETWHTPKEMSGSFSGDEILVNESREILGKLGNENSGSMTEESVPTPDSNPEETPFTRRLSKGHVLLRRPGKRATSDNLLPLSPISSANGAGIPQSGDSLKTALHVPKADLPRVPSLTRSEVSSTNMSDRAATPEGPSRDVTVISAPRQAGNESFEDAQTFEHRQENSLDVGQTASFDYIANEGPTDDYGVAPHSADAVAIHSPKPSSSITMSTPGVARLESPQHRLQWSDRQSTPDLALKDVTPLHQNTPTSLQFTPSPGGSLSKRSDLSTPRAPLNDAERQKSHVLAVLASAGIAGRSPVTRRGPHPLRRVSNANSISSAEYSRPGTAMSGSYVASQTTIQGERTQTANESFVSIASSADLTSDRRAIRTHSGIVRANTSFPTILLPTGTRSTSAGSLKGLSEQRADGVKIHKHLNAMNKQLLETNADLAREAEAWRDEVGRLRDILRDSGIEVEEVDVLADLSARRDDLQMVPENSTFQHDGQRHRSPKSDLLTAQLSHRQLRGDNGDGNDLLDGLTSEQRADVLDEMMLRMDSLEAKVDEKQQEIDALMSELDVAQGFGSSEGDDSRLGSVLHDLQAKLKVVEDDRAAVQAQFAKKTDEHVKRFNEICTGYEEQVASLEGDLAKCRTEVERLRGEKSRLDNLTQTGSQNEREVELRRQLGEAQIELSVAREETTARANEVDVLAKRATAAQEERLELTRKVELAQAQLSEAEARRASLEVELDDAQAQLETRCEHQDQQDGSENHRVQELDELNVQLEEDLDAHKEDMQVLVGKIEEYELELQGYTAEREKADELQNEVDRLNDLLREAEEALANQEGEIESLRARGDLSRSVRTDHGPNFDDEALKELQDQLETAYRDIGRLKHELAATPHRKSVIDMRDMRIQSLEREKAVLQERLASIREHSVNGIKSALSPFKVTPFVQRIVAGLPTPKTPGPMKEMSWLQTTVGDGGEAAFRAQVEYLQKELDSANVQLDANFSRLEAAGFNGLTLAEKLAAAEDRIADLEDELLAAGRGSSPTAAQKRTGMTRDRQSLQTPRDLHQQMEHLKADLRDEKDRLQRDNAKLKDFVTDLRSKGQAEIDDSRIQMERMRTQFESELGDVGLAKEEAMREREALQLELELRQSRIKHLEKQLTSRKDHGGASTSVMTEELREKASTIADLQNSLQRATAETQTVRRALTARSKDLETAENKLATLQRERDRVESSLEAFERDLVAQQSENQMFGRELRRLKEMQNSGGTHRAELAELRDELRSATDGLRSAERNVETILFEKRKLEEWKASHRCDDGKAALEEQKARHKVSTRELAVQIRYLKAKFTRESTFRNALSMQKKYLLLMVGGMSLNEQAVLKQIASMGFPAPQPPRPKRTLKSVAMAVRSLIRAQNAAARWKDEMSTRFEAVVAYDERKRIAAR